MSKIWTYIETETFVQQAKEFGDDDAIQELIEGVLWAISKSPDRFPTIPGTKLQFVRTIEFDRGGSTFVPLKIWFKCIDDHQIEILSISQDVLLDSAGNLDEDDWF